MQETQGRSRCAQRFKFSVKMRHSSSCDNNAKISFHSDRRFSHNSNGRRRPGETSDRHPRHVRRQSQTPIALSETGRTRHVQHHFFRTTPRCQTLWWQFLQLWCTSSHSRFKRPRRKTGPGRVASLHRTLQEWRCRHNVRRLQYGCRQSWSSAFQRNLPSAQS
jgi:hypothetical protein